MTWVQEVDLHSAAGVPLLVRAGVPLLARYRATVDVTVCPTPEAVGEPLGVDAEGDALQIESVVKCS